MSPSTEFLEALGRRGHVTMLEKIRARARVELRNGTEVDYWMVEVDHGDLKVWRGREDADAVIKTERTFFDRVVDGEAHALAALLRGVVRIDGSLVLALYLGKLLPGPPHSRWRGRSGPPSDMEPAWAVARRRRGAHLRAQALRDQQR